MALGTALTVGFGMFLIVVAGGTLCYIWWDRGRIAIVYDDQETGNIDVELVRPDENGVKFDVKGYDTKVIVPLAEFMGTWAGSWKPWTYPAIRLEPRTGRILATSQNVEIRRLDETDEDAQELQPLVQFCWPHIYHQVIDNELAAQAMEQQKPMWKKMQGALLIGFVIMAAGYVLTAYFAGA